MDQRSDALFPSATTVAKVCNGKSRLRRNGAVRKAEQLTDWLEVQVHLCGDRIIPSYIAAPRRTGALMDEMRATSHSPGFADLAAAVVTGSGDLTVLTRNLRHFATRDVRAVNPLESLPD